MLSPKNQEVNEMSDKDSVYEISILGRATWNLHSLNNEGTVGNVTEPRNLVLADGSETDGISGEMLKHIHAMKFWEVEEDKSNFCKACRKLDPQKAQASINEKDPASVVEKALECELCDLHGFLVQKPSTSRVSTIEFGWAVGLPEVEKSVHIHSRKEIGRRIVDKKTGTEKEKCNKCTEGVWKKKGNKELYKVEGDNNWYCEEHIPTAQMLYHRPTRSGEYAIVSVFQPWRIGLNNVTMEYEDVDRERRYKLALDSYRAMFLRMEGSMSTTRLPHAENFEGIIVISKGNFPSPVVTPLKEDYVREVKKLVKVNGKFEMMEFKGLSNFCKKMGSLPSTPATIKTDRVS